MVSVTVNLQVVTDDPSVKVLNLYDGRQFLSLQFGGDATVILPGFNAESAAYARKTADALINAACRIEQAQAETVNA